LILKAFMKMKKFEDALAELTKAVELNPKYPKAFVNRGDVNMQLENFEEAVRDYQEAHNLKPGKTHATNLKL
jgi:Flp pilus assembly protein TadD